jgi:hypothetical protein
LRLPNAPGRLTKGLPDRENQRAEAQGSADATRVEPNLHYGFTRTDRQSLAPQRNAIGPVGSIAVMEDHLRAATG